MMNYRMSMGSEYNVSAIDFMTSMKKPLDWLARAKTKDGAVPLAYLKWDSPSGDDVRETAFDKLKKFAGGLDEKLTATLDTVKILSGTAGQKYGQNPTETDSLNSDWLIFFTGKTA